MTRWLLVAVLLACPSMVHAHTLQFGVLQVRQDGTGATLRLRASGTEGVPPVLGLEVDGPGCALDTEPSREIDGGILTLRAHASCFEGAQLHVTGLAESGVRLAISIVRVGVTETEIAFLEGSNERYVVGSVPRGPPVFRRYAELGVEHLALGFDHLLFLLALLLLVFDPRVERERPVRALFLTVTGFTAGHALTLSCAILAGVSLPNAPVELCIALSIVFLAAELIRDPTTLVFRQPWLVAAGFGLLHGLGFAGALRSLGLPPEDAPEALFAFHVGLEIAQVAFVTLALGALFVVRRFEDRRRWLAYAIGGVAMVYSVARIESLFA